MGMIQFPQSYVSRSYLSSGVTGLGGAVASLVLNAPTIGAKFFGDFVAARVQTTLFTSGLQVLAKWQVLDDDGATWCDAVDSYNPANVVVNTGAGVSGGTKVVKFIAAPPSVQAGSRPARLQLYAAGSGPANASFDSASVAYDFRAPITPYG